MDKITLKALKFHGKHGYYNHEREKGNDFELDVIAFGNFRDATKNSDLDKTFNYELVFEVAKSVFNGPKEKLIETLCQNIGDQIFAKAKNIRQLKVSVRKLNPPTEMPAAYAEITMLWKR